MTAAEVCNNCLVAVGNVRNLKFDETIDETHIAINFTVNFNGHSTVLA